jgi:hypothetical protein
MYLSCCKSKYIIVEKQKLRDVTLYIPVQQVYLLWEDVELWGSPFPPHNGFREEPREVPADNKVVVVEYIIAYRAVSMQQSQTNRFPRQQWRYYRKRFLRRPCWGVIRRTTAAGIDSLKGAAIQKELEHRSRLIVTVEAVTWKSEDTEGWKRLGVCSSEM